MLGLLMFGLILGCGAWLSFAALHLVFKLVFGLLGLMIGGAVSLVVGLALLFAFAMLGLAMLPVLGLLLLPIVLPALGLLLLLKLLFPRRLPVYG